MALVTDHGFLELQRALDKANAQVLNSTTLTEKLAARAVKKRLQDCMHQRKHRAKRAQELRTLESAVQGLEARIARLYRDLQRRRAAVAAVEAHRQLQLQHEEQLWSDEALEDHARAIVVQLFRVYHNGYSLPLAGLQEHFLRSVLATDVVGAHLVGADAFVQQCRLYEQHLTLCVLEPQAWKTQRCGDHAVLVQVEAMMYLRFRSQTIGSLFPSLKRGAVDSQLVQPLVTGTTPVPATYSFVVGSSGYVTSLLVSVQLLKTLQRLLGSLESVAQLTDGAHIDLASGTISIA